MATEILTEDFENLSEFQRVVKTLSARSTFFNLFYNYYDGNHAFNYASDKFKNKFAQRLKKLKDNLCPIAVDAPASRLEVTDFGSVSVNALLDAEDGAAAPEQEENDPAGREIDSPAWRIWKRNLMPLKSKEVHREALRTGEAFVIVGADKNGKARIFPQKSANCMVWKDEETGETIRGAKCWKNLVDGYFYLTVYEPTKIYKFKSKNKAASLPLSQQFWEKRIVAGEQNPLENTLGRVPLVLFDAGKSILKDVIPLNDGINKALADLFVAMEYNSIRQRYIVGADPQQDPETGKAQIPYDHEDQYFTSRNKDAKVGEFKDSDLDSILKVIDSLRAEIARLTGIPAHYFMLGQNTFPSGEAMRTAEARFTEFITELQISFGESWSQVLSLALEIELQGEKMIIETMWSDAAPVGEREMLENGILKQSLGWTDEKIQEEFGLSSKVIKEMAAQKKKQKAEEAEDAARSFNAGAAGALAGAGASGAIGGALGAAA